MPRMLTARQADVLLMRCAGATCAPVAREHGPSIGHRAPARTGDVGVPCPRRHAAAGRGAR